MEYKSRYILAEHLRALMSSRPGFATGRAVQARSDQVLSKSNVDRMMKAQIAVSLDTLDDLAAVFGLSPSALLLPIGAECYVPQSDDAREIAKEFDALPEDRRAAAQAQISLILSSSAPTSEALRRSAERLQRAANRIEQAVSGETTDA